MASKQLAASVSQTVLGTSWYLLIPLSSILIYMFVVLVVFGRGQTFAADPVITITMGILHFAFLQNTTSFAMSAIRENEATLLQVKVDAIVFVAVGFWKGCRLSMLGIMVFFVFYVFRAPVLDWPILLYPVILLAWFLLCWTISLSVATLMVFFRDLEKAIPILLSFLLFLSPVIYTLSFIHGRLQTIVLLNPIASIFGLLQWALLGEPFPGVVAVAAVVCGIVILAIVSHAIYRWGEPKFTKSL